MAGIADLSLPGFWQGAGGPQSFDPQTQNVTWNNSNQPYGTAANTQSGYGVPAATAPANSPFGTNMGNYLGMSKPADQFLTIDPFGGNNRVTSPLGTLVPTKESGSLAYAPPGTPEGLIPSTIGDDPQEFLSRNPGLLDYFKHLGVEQDLQGNFKFGFDQGANSYVASLLPFDETSYLEANPDITPQKLQDMGITARQHYFTYGRGENRDIGYRVPEPAATPAEEQVPAPSTTPTLPSNLPVNADFRARGINSLISQDPWAFYGNLFPAGNNPVEPTVFPQNQVESAQYTPMQEWMQGMFGSQIGIPALYQNQEVINTPGKWGQVM
jgi:hypothetical protein